MDPRIATELRMEARDQLPSLPQHDGSQRLLIGRAERGVSRRRGRDTFRRQGGENLSVLPHFRREGVETRGADEDRVERLVGAGEERGDGEGVLERLELAWIVSLDFSGLKASPLLAWTDWSRHSG